MSGVEGKGPTALDALLKSLTSDALWISIRRMRTTLDIEKPVLDGLKRLQKQEKASLGALASRLLADALRRRDETGGSAQKPLAWISIDMEAKVDLSDKEALYRALDS